MARSVGVLVLALVVPLTLLGPAHAGKQTVHDPKGDGSTADHDVVRLVIDHRHDKVVLDVVYDEPTIQDGLGLRIDTQGGAPWEYDVYWGPYWNPDNTFSVTRRGADQPRCEPRRVGKERVDATVRVVIPRWCLDKPRKIRARVYFSVSDFADPGVERTKWSAWVHRAGGGPWERTVITDANDPTRFDIRKLVVKTLHHDKRGDVVRAKVFLDGGPRENAEFKLKFDMPHGTTWDFKARAGNKSNPRIVTVRHRTGEKMCSVWSSRVKGDAHVITVPVSCLHGANWTRVKAFVRPQTRDVGWTDRTRWSEWVRR